VIDGQPLAAISAILLHHATQYYRFMPLIRKAAPLCMIIVFTTPGTRSRSVQHNRGTFELFDVFPL